MKLIIMEFYLVSYLINDIKLFSYYYKRFYNQTILSKLIWLKVCRTFIFIKKPLRRMKRK